MHTSVFLFVLASVASQRHNIASKAANVSSAKSVEPSTLAIRDKLRVPFLLFFMAAVQQEHIKAEDEASRRRRVAATPAIAATAAIAPRPSSASRFAVWPRLEGKLVWAWDGDGEEEPKRQFCCDRRGKRSSLALALSLALPLPPASAVSPPATSSLTALGERDAPRSALSSILIPPS